MASASLSYQEMENQIVELKKQNDILRLKASIQDEARGPHYCTGILNIMGDPVFVKDNHSRLLIVNDAFCTIFNLERKDIIGKTLGEHVPAHESENFLKIDRQVLDDGIENQNEESLTANGSETMTISTRKKRFLDAEGNKYIVGVIHDITERKKAEDSLKDSEKQLKELNTTKDKLFSIIAHDLIGPFNNIIGLSELLIEDSIDFEDSKKYIKILNSSAKNTLNLLANLLKWAKSQTGQLQFKPEKILFSDAILEIISLHKLLAETKNIALNYFSSDAVEVYADENMLKTVLRNLISNAIKFTNEGGHVRVLAMSRQNHVEITISDNGIGMSEEKSKGLFDLTSMTTTVGSENKNGSGLG